MDIRAYYTKIRRVEQDFLTLHVVVVSKATQDGGREGLMTEVRRDVAAQLIVDGKARIATPEETAQFYLELKEAVERRELDEMKRRVNIMLPDDQAAALRRQINRYE